MLKTIRMLGLVGLTLLAAPAFATALSFNVSDDATVQGGPSTIVPGNPGAALVRDTNYGSASVLGVGADGTTDPMYADAPAQFFLKFDVSALLGQNINNVTLLGWYVDDWDYFTNVSATLRLTGDAWSENTLTWNNKPNLGAVLGTFDAADSAFDMQRTDSGFIPIQLAWDITSALNTQSLADGFLSLAFQSGDENLGANSLEYFGSKEAGMGFQLIAAVPEPGSLALAAIGLAGLASLRRRRV